MGSTLSAALGGNKMKIREQFELPRETGERAEALKGSVKQWIEHDENEFELFDILESLRSREDVVTGRPAPVTTLNQLLDSPHVYMIAFKWEHEINELLEL